MADRFYWTSFGPDEDFVHTQMREYWLATGQLSAAQASQPVDADGHRNLGFLASWGHIPADTTVSDAGWAGPVGAGAWALTGWSQSWAGADGSVAEVWGPATGGWA